MHLPELLAPAGSIEAFVAGFDAGADAFYLGAKDFNARKRAKNLSNDDLRDATNYAHKYGKKIYVAVNTLVFDNEIPALLDLLLFLEQIRVDAVIVQDLGVLDLVRRHFPDLPIHASTQLFCHNSLQAQFLKDAGVSRIILAREMTLPEIKSIAEKVPLEYELFVHGAMCFAFSGCCLFSSYLFGKSGNRGQCRQPCRLAFHGPKGETYPFSMKDLDASPVFEQIMALKPAALKIEGRLRSAEYVAQAVSKYRRLIDQYAKADAGPGSSKTGAHTERAVSQGYYGSHSYADLVCFSEKGTIGEKIGSVHSASSGTLFLRLARPPQKGLRLRLQDKDGRNLYTGNLLQFRTHPNIGNELLVEWRVPRGHSLASSLPCDVYRIGQSAPSGRVAVIRREAQTHKPIHVQLDIACVPGGLVARAQFPDKGNPFERRFPLSTEPAREKGALPKVIDTVFREVDQHPFAVQNILITGAEDLFVPASAVKKARRAFYQELSAHFESQQLEHAGQKRELLIAELGRMQKNLRGQAVPGAWESAQDSMAWVRLDSDANSVSEGKSRAVLPFFVPEHQVAAWKKKIAKLIQANKRRFAVPTYGWLALFPREADMDLSAGPFLYAINTFACSLLRRHGIRSIAVSTDFDKKELSGLLSCPAIGYADAFPRILAATRLEVPAKSFSLKNARIRVQNEGEYRLLLQEGEIDF